MTRIIALALAITAGSAALASDSHGRIDQATQDAIRATLTAEGYEVRKIEADDGYYEAYALKNGERYEIYLDRDLNVIKSERDD
jgi:hypothetical protein